MYGTGATLHGIETDLDGRVEFTVWLSLLWTPVIPISNWSAVYAGEIPPDGITDEGHAFADLKRIPHDWIKNVLIFVRGIVILTFAIGPCAFMIWLTDGRAATKLEMVFVFASIFWACTLVFYGDHRRKRKLNGR